MTCVEMEAHACTVSPFYAKHFIQYLLLLTPFLSLELFYENALKRVYAVVFLLLIEEYSV